MVGLLIPPFTVPNPLLSLRHQLWPSSSMVASCWGRIQGHPRVPISPTESATSSHLCTTTSTAAGIGISVRGIALYRCSFIVANDSYPKRSLMVIYDVCRSGSAADTQAISDYVRMYLDSHSMDLGRLPSVNTGELVYIRTTHHPVPPY